MGRFSADVKLHSISALCGFMHQHIPILEGISGAPKHYFASKKKKKGKNNSQGERDWTREHAHKLICDYRFHECVLLTW